ncbi:MAG: MATE family efflux transporter [Deltaproteobacteria bacterium]|nr:MATE family efflux transporter [Deltaproteobacteria bacterium]
MSTNLREIRALSRLAWPVVVAQLGALGMGVVDTLMVGRLGEQSLAAVAVANALSVALFVFPAHIATGLDPVMSQAFGAGRPIDAGRTAFRGLVLMTLVGLPVMALHGYGDPLLRLMQQPEEIIALGASYVWMVGWSMLPLFWFGMVRQHLQSRGMMLPGTVAILVANAVNIVANAALIYGLWGAPALGVMGSAIATVLARVTMLVVLHAVAWRALREVWPGAAGLFDPRALWRLLLQGVPVGFQIGVEVWAFVSTSFLMGLLGTTAVAAHSIAMSLGTATFAIPLGIGAAASTRVGNLLGAGGDWARAGWLSVALGVGVMSVSAATFTLFPEAFVTSFTTDPQVVALGVSLMPFLAAFQMFDGAQVTLFGVLRGAGDTNMPMVVNLIGWWLVGIPVAWGSALYFDLGPQGVWVGLALGLAVVATLLTVRLRYTVRRGGFLVG